MYSGVYRCIVHSELSAVVLAMVEDRPIRTVCLRPPTIDVVREKWRETQSFMPTAHSRHVLVPVHRRTRYDIRHLESCSRTWLSLYLLQYQHKAKLPNKELSGCSITTKKVPKMFFPRRPRFRPAGGSLIDPYTQTKA